MDPVWRSCLPKEKFDRNGDVCPVDREDGPVTGVVCSVVIEEELSEWIDLGILVKLAKERSIER